MGAPGHPEAVLHGVVHLLGEGCGTVTGICRPVPLSHLVILLLDQEVGVGRTLAGMGASLSQELCPQPLVNRVEGGQEI